MSPSALIEKIPETGHWKMIYISPTLESTQNFLNESGLPKWGERYFIRPVPGYVVSGKTYTLMQISEIKRDTTGPKWGESPVGKKTGPGPALGSLRNVKSAPDMGPGARVTKEGSSLVAGDYEIVPEKNLYTVFLRTRDNDGAWQRCAIMARVDGYPGKTGITRARREVQYLMDEPDAQMDRISGTYPVITPGTIVMYRQVRPELALVSEGVPA